MDWWIQERPAARGLAQRNDNLISDAPSSVCAEDPSGKRLPQPSAVGCEVRVVWRVADKLDAHFDEPPRASQRALGNWDYHDLTLSEFFWIGRGIDGWKAEIRFVLAKEKWGPVPRRLRRTCVGCACLAKALYQPPFSRDLPPLEAALAR